MRDPSFWEALSQEQQTSDGVSVGGSSAGMPRIVLLVLNSDIVCILVVYCGAKLDKMLPSRAIRVKVSGSMHTR